MSGHVTRPKVTVLVVPIQTGGVVGHISSLSLSLTIDNEEEDDDDDDKMMLLLLRVPNTVPINDEDDVATTITSSTNNNMGKDNDRIVYK